MSELSHGPMEGSPKSATEPVRCLACWRPWTNQQERWHAFIADPERTDGLAIEGREVGVFCPDCSRQEFGEGAG